MLFYVLRRVLILIPVYLGLTLSTFTLIRLVPGDAVEIMMGEKAVDPAMHAQALQRLGLDLPLPVQYWHYLTNILQGNFGESFRTRTPVLQDFFGYTDLMVDGSPSPHQSDTTLRWLIDRLRS